MVGIIPEAGIKSWPSNDDTKGSGVIEEIGLRSSPWGCVCGGTVISIKTENQLTSYWLMCRLGRRMSMIDAVGNDLEFNGRIVFAWPG
jgi:hypothetical protein